MKLTKQEIDYVSKLEPFKRYEYFIRKVADFQELWTIIDNNGAISLSDIEKHRLVSFWTAEDFIQSNLTGNWKGFTPIKIDLDNLDDTIIPFIEENEYLLSIFPVNGKSGFVVNLEEFIRDLNDELENYE